jgi:hypothetical protein
MGLIKYQALKSQGGGGGIAEQFLISVLDGTKERWTDRRLEKTA